MLIIFIKQRPYDENNKQKDVSELKMNQEAVFFYGTFNFLLHIHAFSE